VNERKIVALNFKPRPGSRWAQLRAGMTWGEARALGFAAGELNYRVRKGDLALELPPGGRGGVVAADKPGEGVRYVSSAAGERPCLRCRQPFKSEGPGNRLCSYCRTRYVSPFEPG
jgi:hypothetical protein